MRRVIAALIVVGLAAGLWYLWPRSADEDPPPPDAQGSTTTTSAPDLTTTIPAPTSTSAGGSNVVETVAEAEEILRELWFGWFEGIYNQDEDRIREVVGNPALVEAAVDQFDVMEFEAPPAKDMLTFEETEILQTSDTCLVVWAIVDASEIVKNRNDGVFVFLRDQNTWLLISQWAYREDLWANDCDSQLLS